MNLRQKAKKYKQRCEQLEKMAFPYKQHGYLVTEKPIITLEAEQIFEFNQMPTMYMDEKTYADLSKKKLAKKLSENIMDFAKVEIETIHPGYNITRATIKVLNMNEYQ